MKIKDYYNYLDVLCEYCYCEPPITPEPYSHYESCRFSGRFYYAYAVWNGESNDFYGGKITTYGNGGTTTEQVTNHFRLYQGSNLLINATLSTWDTGDTGGGVEDQEYTDPINLAATQSEIISEIDGLMEWELSAFDYGTSSETIYEVTELGLIGSQLQEIVDIQYVRMRWEVPDDPPDFVLSARSYYKIRYSTCEYEDGAELSAYTITSGPTEFIWYGDENDPYSDWIEIPLSEENEVISEICNVQSWSYRWEKGGVPPTLVYGFPWVETE